jgi:hypothetical protein
MTSKRQRGVGQVAVALLMLLLWAGTYALTVSPELHRLLHRDAQEQNHNCLITHIQQQLLLAGLVPVTAPAPALVEVASVRPATPQFPPTHDYRLSPSRAPPHLFSSAAVAG